LINKNGWRILDLRRSGNGPPLLAGDGLLFAPTKAKSRSGVAVSRVALGFLAAAEAEDGVQQKRAVDQSACRSVYQRKSPFVNYTMRRAEGVNP